LIIPKIRNLDAVDEQVDELECSKIGCPGYHQTSVISLTQGSLRALAPELLCLQQSCTRLLS
jgi:hypothetical protein